METVRLDLSRANRDNAFWNIHIVFFGWAVVNHRTLLCEGEEKIFWWNFIHLFYNYKNFFIFYFIPVAHFTHKVPAGDS